MLSFIYNCYLMTCVHNFIHFKIVGYPKLNWSQCVINDRHEMYTYLCQSSGSILGDFPISVPNSLCSLVFVNLVTFFLYCNSKEVDIESMINTRSSMKIAKLIQSRIVKFPNSMECNLFTTQVFYLVNFLRSEYKEPFSWKEKFSLKFFNPVKRLHDYCCWNI